MKVYEYTASEINNYNYKMKIVCDEYGTIKYIIFLCDGYNEMLCFDRLIYNNIKLTIKNKKNRVFYVVSVDVDITNINLYKRKLVNDNISNADGYIDNFKRYMITKSRVVHFKMYKKKLKKGCLDVTCI